jgi:hypothetical protein
MHKLFNQSEGESHAVSATETTQSATSSEGDEGQEGIVDVTGPPNRFPTEDDELPLAARTAKPGYRKGQPEQAEVDGEESQDPADRPAASKESLKGLSSKRPERRRPGTAG